ncbi:MAG: cell division protein FtsH, partial [Planctomycetes bacterium]|nr:cell division protein FtsH [Planctomycetota bacterium]
EWGMSDLVGPINYSAPAENNFLGRDFAYGNDHSEETQNLIDAEVKKIVDEGYHRAKTILVEERGVLDRLAEALLRYETISGEEVKEIVAGAAVESLRPANEPHIPPGGLTADTKRPRDEKESRREDDLGFSGASGLAPSS